MKNKLKSKKLVVFLIVLMIAASTVLGLVAVQQQRLAKTIPDMGFAENTYISLPDDYSVISPKEDTNRSESLFKMMFENAVVIAVIFAVFINCLRLGRAFREHFCGRLPVTDKVVMLE